MIDLSRATATLRERLLTKIVMPGPATPCATWVGGYNRHGFRRRTRHFRRPVICEGGHHGQMLYVAPVLLTLASDGVVQIAGAEACHRGCPTGAPIDGVYRCVDLDHLRWGSRQENEEDKRRVD